MFFPIKDNCISFQMHSVF